MILLIIIILTSLIISALCSLLEACSLSLSLTDIANLSLTQPHIANIWKAFKKQIEKPIAVILILNTLAHTIGASLAGAQFDHLFGSKWIALYSLVFAFIMIQWTELLPKTLGVKHNRKIAVVAALPLKLLTTLFSPLIHLTNFLNYPFSGKKRDLSELDAIHDISVLAQFAVLNNILSKDQEEILSRTIQLSKLKVRDIMVKRDEIKYLSTAMNLTNALLFAHIHHHTRFPLIENENINRIIGYINFKDIVSALQINPDNPSLEGICRPVLSVYEDVPFSVILNKLTRGYQHIAVVIDHQENVLGIVTLEDVIESIIGEVSDEYDKLPDHFYQITDHRYISGGGILLNELKQRLQIQLPEKQVTLSEWLIQLHGSVPKIEQSILYTDICFIVRKIRRSNISEVIIETNHSCTDENMI